MYMLQRSSRHRKRNYSGRRLLYVRLTDIWFSHIRRNYNTRNRSERSGLIQLYGKKKVVGHMTRHFGHNKTYPLLRLDQVCSDPSSFVNKLVENVDFMVKL